MDTMSIPAAATAGRPAVDSRVPAPRAPSNVGFTVDGERIDVTPSRSGSATRVRVHPVHGYLLAAMVGAAIFAAGTALAPGPAPTPPPPSTTYAEPVIGEYDTTGGILWTEYQRIRAESPR